jgi:hypothetical protein
MNNSSKLYSVQVEPIVTPKEGDILHGIFGYDATISTFAKVVKVTKSSVVLIELDQHRIYENNQGGMFWKTTPIPASSSAAYTEVTKRFKQTGGHYYVKWTNYQTLFSGYDGSPVSNENTH